MKYHNITKDDMLNGDGLRVVMWVSGCEHHCQGCQNPLTWNPEDGLEFGKEALDEIRTELSKPYVSGITFSGGDPLHPANRLIVTILCQSIKRMFPNKTIWIYTGYRWEDVCHKAVMHFIDVLVDGEFKEELKDVNYPWAGSTNQRVIDVQKSLKEGKVVLHASN